MARIIGSPFPGPFWYSTFPLKKLPERAWEWATNDTGHWPENWTKQVIEPSWSLASRLDFDRTLEASKLLSLYDGDPSTRSLWYGVATAHDLEAHVGSILWPKVGYEVKQKRKGVVGFNCTAYSNTIYRSQPHLGVFPTTCGRSPRCGYFSPEGG
jgi:hypothetical protein